jgi:hypothetical protein
MSPESRDHVYPVIQEVNTFSGSEHKSPDSRNDIAYNDEGIGFFGPYTK